MGCRVIAVCADLGLLRNAAQAVHQHFIKNPDKPCRAKPRAAAGANQAAMTSLEHLPCKKQAFIGLRHHAGKPMAANLPSRTASRSPPSRAAACPDDLTKAGAQACDSPRRRRAGRSSSSSWCRTHRTSSACTVRRNGLRECWAARSNGGRHEFDLADGHARVFAGLRARNGRGLSRCPGIGRRSRREAPGRSPSWSAARQASRMFDSVKPLFDMMARTSHRRRRGRRGPGVQGRESGDSNT